MAKRKFLKTWPGKLKNELGRIYEYKGKTKTTYGYVLELPRSADGSRNRADKGGLSTIMAAVMAKREMEKTTNAASPSAVMQITRLKDFFEKVYVPYLQNNDRSINTIISYTTAINVAYKHFGENIELHEFTKKHYESYKTYLLKTYKKPNGEPLSRASINLRLTVLKNLLSVAVELGYLSSNPLKGRLLKPDDSSPAPYSDDEISKIFDVIFSMKNGDVYKFALPCYIMLYTGMRIGEVLALRWEQIDFTNKIIHVQNNLVKVPKGEWLLSSTKGKYDREVPLVHVLEKLLIEAKYRVKVNQLKMGSEYITSDFVCVKKNGELCTIHSMSSLFKAMKARGIEYENHRFRDTYISRALNHGVSPIILMDIVGHKDLKITLRHYAKIEDDSKAKAAKTIVANIKFT